MQGLRIRTLVREDPTVPQKQLSSHLTATEPVLRNPAAATPEEHVPQEKPP